MNFQTRRAVEVMIAESGKIEITIVDAINDISENIVITTDNYEYAIAEVEGYEIGYDVYL